jgi:exportin-1
VTLKCFTEISSLEITEGYFEVVVSMFTNIMATVNRMIPPSTSKSFYICMELFVYFTYYSLDIGNVYENSNDDDQEFVQNLALFLTTFLSNHLRVSQEKTKKTCINFLFFYQGC